MNVLHVASEVAPFSKTGGLGDVASALPKAQAQLGAQVTVVSALYGSIQATALGLAKRLRTFDVPVGDTTYKVGLFEGSLPGRLASEGR